MSLLRIQARLIRSSPLTLSAPTTTSSALLLFHCPSPLTTTPPTATTRTRTRTLHTSPSHCAGSPLFALGALSNSRESQWFKKASGLSAVEHSPNLQLIRDSEVVPFASPGSLEGKGRAKGKRGKAVVDKEIGRADGARNTMRMSGIMGSSHTKDAATTAAASAASMPRLLFQSTATPPPPTLHRQPLRPSTRDIKAISVGREVLRRNAEHVGRLKRSLRQEKRIRANEVKALKKENKRLLGENRSASVGIVVAVAVATAVVAWKTWPEARKPRVGFKTGRKDESVVDEAVPVVEDMGLEPPVLASIGGSDIVAPLLPLGELGSVQTVNEKDQATVLEMPTGLPKTDAKKATSWNSWFWNHS